jgi:hypothetical protein
MNVTVCNEGKNVHTPTGDMVTGELLLTQQSNSRHHQLHGTHMRKIDPLCDFDILSDI